MGSSTVEFVSRSSLRKTVLSRLTKSPCTPSELATIENKHVSHISRALSELRGRGLVECDISGSRERYYRATSQGYLLVATLLKATR